MKNTIRVLIVLYIFLVGSNVFGAIKIFDYGFEDWTGNMYTTPGYPFTSGYAEYMDGHAAGSEVITSYNANEMGQTWTARSGSYFLIQNDSSSYALSPSVSGITGGGVNLHNNVGYDGRYGGPSNFDMDESITTGEVFIRLWARFNNGWRTIQDGGRNKWLRFYANTNAVPDTVYMHLGTWNSSPPMYFYCSGEPGYWIGSSFTCTNAYDGNWHKFSMYINWNTGVILGWYDVDNETIENASKSYSAEDGRLGNGSGPQFLVLKSNYSAKSPTEETYHAIDDLEIWDGMPDEDGEDTYPPADVSDFTAQPGDSQVSLSWTNPTDIDFAGTMIRYRTDGTYPVDHTDGTLVSNRTGARGSSDSFTHTQDVVNGVTYYYSAFTYDEVPNYSEASHARATPQEGVSSLPPPSGMTGLIHLWNAEAQTGDSSWSNSGVTWCVRVLVQGDSITSPGSPISLGFQGRTSGDYTIRKVSIAERDMNGAEGDVMNSTWTRVIFDGRSTATWANDQVTIPEGAIKRSDSMSLYITPEKDYYVTFLLESPSVYLIAPSGYRELYFDGEDHTDDVDWSGNGHSTRLERLHAFSSIDVVFE